MKTQTIEWAPFAQKHKDYIKNALCNKMSVAEGAIRSGKTIDHCIIAAMYLEKCRDKIHLATGSTIANAKLNIGVCNGFGLENLFRGRSRWGKYKDNDCMYIQTQTGEKIVIFVGGGKADSYKRILGNSYGLWIATEINEHYDEEDSRTSFIKVAFGRQAAAQDPLILWDLNPSNPHHPIYERYIDKYRADGLLGGYQYEHFTLADNLSITPERRAEIESQYDPMTIWYRRDILGERCIAEGLVYQLFADNPEKFVIKGDPQDWLTKNNKHISIFMVGVDFGGTNSASKFQATGITADGYVIALDEEYINHNKQSVDPDRLNALFRDFIKRVTSVYGYAIVRADSAEQILINGLRHTVEKEGLRAEVHNAKKTGIMEVRVPLENLLMVQGRLFVSERCPHLIDAFCTAIYDEKKYEDTRLDDGTSDIDSLDAFEYSIEPYAKELERAGHRR